MYFTTVSHWRNSSHLIFLKQWKHSWLTWSQVHVYMILSGVCMYVIFKRLLILKKVKCRRNKIWNFSVYPILHSHFNMLLLFQVFSNESTLFYYQIDICLSDSQESQWNSQRSVFKNNFTILFKHSVPLLPILNM